MRAALARWGDRHGARILAIAFFIPAALLFAPILYYSLDTPFGLVDDYADWKYSIIFTNPSLFRDWVEFTFFDTDVRRYRPFWDLYNAASWSIFGTTPWLHHLSRWAFHFASVLLFVAAFLRFARPDGRDEGSRTWMLPLVPVSFLAYIWLFFPNSPASRLSPQEVYTVFFLGICTLAVALTLKGGGKSGWIHSGGVKYVLFLCGYTGLVFSKEVNVAVALWLLIAYAVHAVRHGGRRILVGLAPLVLILAFTIVRTYVASGNYDSVISLGSFVSHAKFIATGLFQVETSLVITAIFSLFFVASLAGSFVNRKYSRDFLFILFLIGQVIFLCLAFAISSQEITMRYWYPLIPGFVLILAFSVKYFLIYSRKISVILSGTIVLATVALISLYVTMNYYNFSLQTISQHSARNSDQSIISQIPHLHASGQHVRTIPQEEPEYSLLYYFAEYQPFFQKIPYGPVTWLGWPYVIDIPFLYPDDIIHITPPLYPETPYYLAVYRRSAIPFDFLDLNYSVSAKNEYEILSHARTLAEFLQGGPPHVSIDHGAPSIGEHGTDRYGWAIYEVPFGDPVDRVIDSLRAFYQQTSFHKPISISTFDIYSIEDRLIYVRDECDPEDVESVTIYLHVTPTDTSSLPERLRPQGFANLDFRFDARGARFDGRCVASVQLPDYPIFSISTGQYPGDGAAWSVEFMPGLVERLRTAYEQVANSAPVVRSIFALYFIEDQLIYVREQCTSEDTEARFFLHLTPVDTGDLPGERRRHGFANLDFRFAVRGTSFDGRCVASMPLPDYPIASIRTGQYGDEGDTWSVEFAPER